MVNNKYFDALYFSLSDPIRRNIVSRIANNDLDLQKVANDYKVSLPAVSKHLKVLERSNLIFRERIGREYKFTLSEATKYWLMQFQNLEKFLEDNEKR